MGNFGVNTGRPIVTNGSLWRSCANVREAMELFGVVSGVGSDIGIWKGEGEVFWADVAGSRLLV